MIVFDGKKLASGREVILRDKINRLGMKPKLVVFQVGHNLASDIYLRLKLKAAERVGIDFKVKQFNEDAKVEEIVKVINQMNNDPRVSGIFVQLPLPNQLSISRSINPLKDIDCLTPENLGLLTMGQPRFLPATVKGIVEIIQSYEFKIQGSNAVVVGGSNIVGKPLALVLSNMGATVTICRSKTENLSVFTKNADILISATGVEKLMKKDMIKEGAIVIDAGSPKGDVDFEAVKDVASFITPVPGGVGPMTVVSLLENTLKSFTKRTKGGIDLSWWSSVLIE